MNIFTHIPRTGGTSLRFHLKKEMKGKPILLEAHRKIFLNKKYNKNLFFLQGHIPFGIHNCLGKKKEGCRYFTFLRDPIDRWKSFFYLDIKRGKKPLKKILWDKKSGGTIDGFLGYSLRREIHSNIMVKQLSGMEKYSNINEKKGLWSYTWASRKKKYTHEEMMEMVDRAEYNVLNTYYFVGLISNYQRDTNLFCSKLGLKGFDISTLYRRPSSKNKVNFSEPRVVDTLEEINKYDIILYDRVKDKINERNQKLWEELS